MSICCATYKLNGQINVFICWLQNSFNVTLELSRFSSILLDSFNSIPIYYISRLSISVSVKTCGMYYLRVLIRITLIEFSNQCRTFTIFHWYPRIIIIRPPFPMNKIKLINLLRFQLLEKVQVQTYVLLLPLHQFCDQ